MACVALVTGACEMTSELTDATAPVKSFFLTVPYPTTTISSNVCVSSCNVIFKILLLPFSILISCDVYPMKLISKILFSFTSNANFPSMSVIVPLVVPFSTTFAPIIGSPFLSITVPVICLELCCCSVTIPFFVITICFPITL